MGSLQQRVVGVVGVVGVVKAEVTLDCSLQLDVIHAWAVGLVEVVNGEAHSNGVLPQQARSH